MWDYLFNALLVLLLILVWLAVLARAILRPHREPASRIAWVAVIGAMPGLGMLVYLLLGETSIGRKRVARNRAVLDSLPPAAPPSFENDPRFNPPYPDRYCHPCSGWASRLMVTVRLAVTPPS